MNAPQKKNILQEIASNLPEEVFETLIHTNKLKIERIVSKGQHSEENFWYDQSQPEWVLVLKGEAHLEFENALLELKAGDYVNIEAHRKHRVKWTTLEEETIWLAVFY